MIARNRTDYLQIRQAEARRIVADPDLCAARPSLRRTAWKVLTGPRAARTLHLTAFMRDDLPPESAA